MSAPIFLYPFLSDNMLSILKIQSKGWSVYYHNSSGEPVELDYKPADINEKVNCIEADGIWDADSYDLCLGKEIALSHYRCLFGPEGIACKNAKLGISVVWTSVESRQRGVFEFGNITVTNEDLKEEKDRTSTNISIRMEFPVAKFRGDVNFSVILHIAEPGIPAPDEIHLANENGFILGEIDSFTLRLDGTGSLFPVYESDDKSKPLWYVMCNWIDPLSDSFSDSVGIYLNRVHKNYKYIDQTQKTFCKQLLVEVMSAAICCIVEEARNSGYWDQILSDESHEHGSVAEAIRYFQDTLGWNLTSPASLSESARQFFDGRMPD